MMKYLIIAALLIVGCSKEDMCWQEVETIEQYKPQHYRINGYDVGFTGHNYEEGGCLPYNNFWRSRYEN